jgi:uncharacterized membrane protein YccC
MHRLEIHMPGEEGFISALTAPVVNLAIAAVVVALIAVVLMTLLYVLTSRQSSNTLKAALDNADKLLGALVTQGNQLVTQGQQINRHGEQLESMIRVMEAGQAQGRQLQETAETHEGNNVTRSQQLMTRIDTMAGEITNLIEQTGKQAAEGTDKVAAILRQLLDSMSAVKNSVDEARTQQATQRETQTRALDAIEDKLGLVSEQVIDVIQAIGESNREDTTHENGGADVGSGDVSAGSASGSAGGDSSGTADDSSGISSGAIA